ncbi:MAG: sulfite exporter TauE/SafE family protein [Planctomycetes bacterium]|nr:sulfite exporter TauE/SafE family protein [Planctomycetota bacterium]
MDLLPIALTIVAGVAMGAINNVAGGAGVLGLLAFEYAFDLPLSTANPSTRIAAVAVGSFACLGFLRSGRAIPKQAFAQALLALPGALLGAQLALALPEPVFRGYLAIVMLLLLRQQLRPIQPGATASPFWFRALGCFFIGLHMGYVQVGTGLVAALVLSKAYDRDLLAVNAAKSIVVIVTSVASATSLTIAGAITWTPAIALAVGCAAGSYVASKWSVKKGGDAVRRVVVVIAVLTLLEQLRQIVTLLTADAPA